MAGTTVPPRLFQQQIIKSEFSSLDYYCFSGMLGFSVLIGIYFGCFGSKQNTKNEYLMGGRTMDVIPIAISLVASHTSGIAILSVPADIYKYGSNYACITTSIILSTFGCSYIFLPVFYKLQLTSSYEYLTIRFDRKVRSFASFLYTLFVLSSSPITIYVPALAFSHATGSNVHVLALIICSICIFYTTVGGVKAVVWTDTLQTIVMVASMVVVFILGIISAGGIWNVIDSAQKGQRFEIDFDIDPTVRDTFWTYTIGSTFHWFNIFAVSQVTVQRLLSVPTLTAARRAVVLTCIGIVLVKLSGWFTGLIMYSKYSDCDPLLSKQITRTDQLLPHYVLDVAGNIPGLSGLFISGVLGAALSTLSGVLNALAATIYEDFILPFMPKDITEKRTSYILKLIVIVAGILFTALVFVVENLGGLLPLATSFYAMSGGALLGLFSLGMLFPTSNAKGALYGGICGLIVTSSIVMGSLWYKHLGLYADPVKPLSVNGCAFPANITLKKANFSDQQPFYLFRISFWYYTLIGTAVTIVIGMVVSWFTNEDTEPVDPDLLSPIVTCFLNKRRASIVLDKKYFSVDKALQLIEKEENI